MIYVHIPFCHRKCTYCAFYSRPVGSQQSAVDAFVNALLAETEQRRSGWLHPIHTIYFGGGTPSILPIEQLARIVDGLHRCFDLSQLEEMTIEANPEDLTPQYLASIRRLGFNRLSVGIQSLDDNMLRLLNRRHTTQQAIDAVENAHSAGFHNISVDFIYGLPNYFQFSFFNFQLITHVSAYALTVEPGTALAMQLERGGLQLPDDDEVVEQYHTLHHQFSEAGFMQYEVSNYARPGYESKHNTRYWNRTPYLGLGPAAHSFDGTRRRWNISDTEKYTSCLTSLKGQTYYEEEILTPDDAYNELLMTSLRTTRGLDLSLVPEQYKVRLRRQVQFYIDCGWLEVSTLHSPLSTLIPTTEGLLHADGMAATLFM